VNEPVGMLEEPGNVDVKSRLVCTYVVEAKVSIKGRVVSMGAVEAVVRVRGMDCAELSAVAT
jgi:hypothetical protein